MNFWNQHFDSGDVNGHLVILEDAIATERRKIAELDRELQARGVDCMATEEDDRTSDSVDSQYTSVNSSVSR